jgi:flavin-dependent dehydrogenase
VAIGDAFCVTNPQGGRGVTLGMQSAAVLADLIRDERLKDLAGGLDSWGATHLLPWYYEHVNWDAALLALWAGRLVDPEGPIGLDVLVSAAQERHPEWMAVLMPFFSMETMPSSLEPLREAVREMVRQGWQPQQPDGPDRDQLAALVHAALAEAVPA